MGPLIVIAIAAGAASALLAAGVAAGSLMAVPLFYLAPLPVMIAGIAFSPWAALGAAIVAAGSLGFVFGHPLLIAYALGMGGPAFALSYAAMLAREEPAARDGVLWFPVGGLIGMAAGLATLAVLVALFSMSWSFEAYEASVISAFEALVGQGGQSALAGGTDTAAMGALLARLLPPMAGALSMVSQLACLYLAGKAALVSQRLTRPWPDLSAFRLPRGTPLALAAALLLTMAPSMLGLAASVAAATLILAFALAGFALVHALTRGHTARVLVLSGVWATSLMLGWPLLAMAALGLADALFDLRARVSTPKGPPAANDR
ncbi:DUF2232 domain-containing protein [Xanthobacter tagetidis]|jgi:hypothetical protein|uniref:DUF2232 domain-containing protein n=1 Tax=Xanthobacter tagetidis TaxID=60216 RepID=A0A3L7A1L6_9HYPH|nr:DUF2232 domain-containing protein [Xanthobacter tagetidis]MBB6307094.1 hypothetical protein [Xanthobacter tagetidis]RLP73262.1 DUF2232 domain-containing protein [Xanthobacter tagetidis]